MANSKKICEEMLQPADIKINGNRSWDIQVNDERFYPRVLSQGSLGLGESYIEGWWDCKAIDQAIYRILSSNMEKKVKRFSLILPMLKSKLINLQKKSKAFDIGKKHYDIGNDLFENMLDKRLVYTCAYWKNAQDLNQAQEDKLELTCKKLKLKPGMTVLDIGCGWGSFLKYAAEKYKIKGVGITVSKEQVKLARELCKRLPIEIRLQDYRDVNEKFDRIVSLGMFEHVGPKNYRTYMEAVDRCLKSDGIFLLHTIGGIKTQDPSYDDPWIKKYIFPGGHLPSASQIIKSAEKLFILQDWHNFGVHYDKTLLAWNKNFQKNWHKIKNNYNNRFKRMWEYYLLSCAGAFRSGRIQLWQIIFSKFKSKLSYESVR